MILSRVIEHVKAQNWTAVALDFVIVVMGVFIANQVTTWRDDAALSKRKAAAVERLHDESEAIVDYVGARVALFEENNAAIADTLDRLSRKDLAGADVDRMAVALDSLALAPAAAPPRSAYDELIGAGLFADVGDARLRQAVAEYYAGLSFLQAQIDYVRQGKTAESAQRMFPGLRHVYDKAAFRNTRLEIDPALLAADAAFLDFALGGASDQIAQQQWWTLLLIKASAMCDEIARYDGRACAPPNRAQGADVFGIGDPRTAAYSGKSDQRP